MHDHRPNSTGNAKPVFSARLTPHRSLSRSGFIILMIFVWLICMGVGGYLFYLGAWPVFGFIGLDILLIYAAFKINYRSACAFEDIHLSRERVYVRQVSPRGREKQHFYNPFATRFIVDRHDEIGITDMMLRSRERRLSIGRFLNPVDKESFADAFGLALARVKR